MKKILATILICTILLISSVALAESSSVIEAVPIAEQLDMIGESELHDTLIGTWYCHYIAYYNGYSWTMADSENSISLYSITINENGTAFFHTDAGDTTFNINIDSRISSSNSRGIEDYIQISMYDSYTGDFCFTVKFQMPESGLMGYCYYPDYYIDLIYSYDSYGLEQSFFFVKNCLPANELAAVNTNTNLSDFNGRWELIAANKMDRAVDYDAYSNHGYYTCAGMPCTIDTAYDSMILEYNGGNWWYGYGMTEPVDGIIEVQNSDNWRGNAIIYIGEDENLYIELHEMTMKFRRLVIDPMTEYDDTETIFSVQNALNSLGYDCGTPDGFSGQKTEAAITAFQTDNGLTVTGTITEETLECMRGYGFIF